MTEGTAAPHHRDLSRLTGILEVSLGVYVAVALIALWSGWLEVEFLQRAASGAAVTEAEATLSDSRQALVGGVQLLVFVVTAVIFLRWTYLSGRNARSLGGTGMRFTPGWAVGWYFVPIATLWKPYQALKETFKASHPDFSGDWQHAPHPSVLPVWWTLWILGNVVGLAVSRFTLRAETIDALMASSWITLAADALDLPLGIAAVVVVAKLQRWQSEKYRRLAAATDCRPGDPDPADDVAVTTRSKR